MLYAYPFSSYTADIEKEEHKVSNRRKEAVCRMAGDKGGFVSVMCVFIIYWLGRLCYNPLIMWDIIPKLVGKLSSYYSKK